MATVEAAHAAHMLRACLFDVAPSGDIIGLAPEVLRDAARADAAFVRARGRRGSGMMSTRVVHHWHGALSGHWWRHLLVHVAH